MNYVLALCVGNEKVYVVYKHSGNEIHHSNIFFLALHTMLLWLLSSSTFIISAVIIKNVQNLSGLLNHLFKPICFCLITL